MENNNYKDFDEQIRTLEDELISLQKRTTIIKDTLKKLYKEYEQLCSHPIFKCDQDSDGHKTIRTYICKNCKYQTRYAPEGDSSVEW